MEIIYFIVGLIALIVFFIMAVALRNISDYLRRVTQILNGWSRETGYGMKYSCNSCKKIFYDKKATCPHCGAVQKYE